MRETEGQDIVIRCLKCIHDYQEQHKPDRPRMEAPRGGMVVEAREHEACLSLFSAVDAHCVSGTVLGLGMRMLQG